MINVIEELYKQTIKEEDTTAQMKDFLKSLSEEQKEKLDKIIENTKHEADSNSEPESDSEEIEQDSEEIEQEVIE